MTFLSFFYRKKLSHFNLGKGARMTKSQSESCRHISTSGRNQNFPIKLLYVNFNLFYPYVILIHLVVRFH
jgi:hypothetical protein